MVKSLLIVALMPVAGILQAQDQKIEIEERISTDIFPTPALAYLEQAFPAAGRVRFYREASLDSITYEAKFRWRGVRYSVEFFPDGSLMDVERVVPYRSIPQAVRDHMEQVWEQSFRKYKVKRCQEQISPKGIRYEVEVRGRASDGTAFYEYLFEADGSLVHRKVMVLRPNDFNLY